jgi:hypothetical protein
MTSINFTPFRRAAIMILLQVLLALTGTKAFQVTSPEPFYHCHEKVFQKSSTSVSLYGMYRGRDDDNYRDVAALNKARTDIRNFLTQRAVQSFVFLLSHCRDEATVRWLEVSCYTHNPSEKLHRSITFNPNDLLPIDSFSFFRQLLI